MKKQINLSPSLQQNWVDFSLKNIIRFCISLFLILMMVISLIFYNGNRVENIFRLNKTITEQKEQLEKIEQSLTNLTPLPINYAKVLKSKEIEKLVSLLQGLPVKSAGISVIKFYVDQGLKLKIAGAYHHQQDFEALENFFKENGFSIDIEYLQSSDKVKADFSIIVYKEEK